MTDSTNPLPARQPGRAAFAFIFVTVMLDMLALGIVIPVLPKLIKEFEGGDIASAVNIMGLFSFSWAVMQFIFQPVLGGLSDRFGRRPVAILSNLGLGLDYVLMALAPTLWFLFVGRLISGICAASFATAGAYIADVTPKEKRAARFGMLGAAFGLGFVIGPAVGGLLGSYDLRLPFWGAAVLSLANAAYGFFILPESLPRELRRPFVWRASNPLGAMKFLRSNPLLARLTVASFLQRFAHGSLPAVFVLYADYRYGWDEKMVGLTLAAVGVAQMTVSGALVGPIVARIGEKGALILGLVSGFIGFAGYGMASSGTMFLLALPFVAFWGLAGPALQSLTTKLVSPTQQGQLQGAQSSLQSVADMVGPIIFTRSFSAVIATGSVIRLPGTPYLISALLVLGALAVSWRVSRPAVAL